MPKTMLKPPSEKANAGDKRLKVLDITIKRNQHRQDALIEILHKAQSSFGYLEEEVLIYIAHQLKLPLSQVFGVATFYHLFSLKPSGAHNCVVCLGTACYVKGSAELLDKLAQEVNLHEGETTPDGKVSLMTARCIGACGLAPAAVYDGKVCGKQTSEAVLAQVKQWLENNEE
ncbi:bidirectional hydrogenase complex protein HoxE [Geminocystis sp. CENA526]|uniref:bidirectional hydrogenase complex protein HoxE n=1 Tax=Geminocystis sp. CENA526 TaxID=1355871 RepID=UPI003D6E8E03